MATLLGTSFSTDENAVVQAGVRLLGKTVESLVVKFYQEKFEEFLSSGSPSPKAMRQYHKVSSETHSRISSEITPKVARTTAQSASGATSEEVLKISCTTHAARVNLSQETTGPVRRRPIKVMMKISSAVFLLSKLYNFKLPGVPNNSYDST